MQYRVIGLMSGSSLDGLDIVYTEFEETGNNWSYEIKAAACAEYSNKWTNKLKAATNLNAYDYLLLDSAYGKYVAEKVNSFIDANDLHHKVQLIGSHGHTVFHAPQLGITAQLGNGATIAASTGINVVTDLRIMDVVLGGQGAPIVPVGEKLLFKEYNYFLNLGGIANISANLLSSSKTYIAFDVCPANRVLNMLASKEGKLYDDKGAIGRTGSVNTALLTRLNDLEYYKQSYPKSLANYFGTDIVYPWIESFNLSTADALRTYTEHIIQQIVNAINLVNGQWSTVNKKMLVTGGGAFNDFLIERLRDALKIFNIEVVVPGENLIKYKEALIMGLLGVLRWREEDTVMSSVTGASRNSIGGAVWMGQES
jgi:anhydro-N-acetylmuramic acid kinase